MSNKVTIIGAGSVGSTIAYNMVVTGIASEIVHDRYQQRKGSGRSSWISARASPSAAPASIYAGSYVDAEDSDIVILTSGIARKPGQSRLELAQTNVNITKSIIPEIARHAPNATYIIVSNPVDILTYTFHKFSGLPENRIIGSGTILDTARLRARLSEYYNISQSNVHAYVFGEHGDFLLHPWSVANISNVPILRVRQADHHTRHRKAPSWITLDIEQYVRKSGGRVIARKGATFLCDFYLRMPHLQVPVGRRGYHNDCFQHDARASTALTTSV